MACKDKDYFIQDNILIGKSEPLHDINIGDAILSTLKSRPNFIGQVDAETGEQIAFQQMRKNSVKCALWLQKKGIGNNDRITICTCNQMIAYIPLLASMFIGATVILWDNKYFLSDTRILFFLTAHEPKVIFIDEDIAPRLKSALAYLWQHKLKRTIPKIIVFGKFERFFDFFEIILNGDFDNAEIDEFSCVEKDSRDNAILTFSSNATSYEAGKIFLNIRHFAFTYPPNQEVPIMFPGDIGLWYGSLCWGNNMLLTFRSIISYVTAIKSSKFNEINLYETIEKYKVSWVFLDSYMCNQLLQTDVITKYDLSSLREFLFGNIAIARDVHEGLIKSLPNVSIIQIYSTMHLDIISAYQRSSEKIGSSGYVAKNVQMKFIDQKTKEPVGPNVNGEIWCSFLVYSCSNFDGDRCSFPYCNNDKTKITPKFQEGTTDWFNTKDFGYYDDDGNIFVIDKTKNLIKYKNFLVSSRKIENLLQRHPAVSEVVVVSVPHSTDGQHPVAYIKKKYGVEVTEEELIKFVERNLPDSYRLRGGLFFKDKMLYLPNEKIDRSLIRQTDNPITDFRFFS